ncbi:hypothetical protein GIB67_008781 [Kingdonia uniflora]|uniref:F-box domain-containing protein n=1 Tax=Kingdonia uniflora TaxID=39325 RepID=A0A7J7P5K6_9MAGN|nr:hypothetical protein GIB67_008781 [Kingdonia uniflora]
MDNGSTEKNEIFSLGDDLWQDLNFPYKTKGPCVFINGSFHWLSDQNVPSRMVHIIKLDISSEKVQIIKICLPSDLLYSLYCNSPTLINVEDSLAFYNGNNEIHTFQISKVVEEMNGTSILQHVISEHIKSRRNFKLILIGALDSTKLVFKERELDDRIALYLLRNRKYMTIEKWRYSSPNCFDSIMFTPSLLSPRDICATSLRKNYQATGKFNLCKSQALLGHQMYSTMIGKRGSVHYEEHSEGSKPSDVSVNIPFDIIYHILFRLPIEALTRCKIVRHEWHRLIKDPTYMDMQLRTLHQQPSIILYDKDYNYYRRNLSLVAIEKQKKKAVIISRSSQNSFEVLMFTPSLVSPSDICTGFPRKKII